MKQKTHRLMSLLLVLAIVILCAAPISMASGGTDALADESFGTSGLPQTKEAILRALGISPGYEEPPPADPVLPEPPPADPVLPEAPPADGTVPDGEPPADGTVPDGEPPADGTSPDGEPPADGSLLVPEPAFDNGPMMRGTFVGTPNATVEIYSLQFKNGEHAVLSGNDMVFYVVAKTSGINAVYENAEIVVDLIYDSTYSEYKSINGFGDHSSYTTEPIDDDDNGIEEGIRITIKLNDDLTYSNTRLFSIVVSTENGITPDGTAVTASATMTGDPAIVSGAALDVSSGDCEIKILSAPKDTIVKKCIQDKVRPVAAGGDKKTVTWDVTVIIPAPKNNPGSLLPKGESTFTITDLVPIGMVNVVNPATPGTWTFDPAAYAVSNIDVEVVKADGCVLGTPATAQTTDGTEITVDVTLPAQNVIDARMVAGEDIVNIVLQIKATCKGANEAADVTVDTNYFQGNIVNKASVGEIDYIGGKKGGDKTSETRTLVWKSANYSPGNATFHYSNPERGIGGLVADPDGEFPAGYTLPAAQLGIMQGHGTPGSPFTLRKGVMFGEPDVATAEAKSIIFLWDFTKTVVNTSGEWANTKTYEYIQVNNIYFGHEGYISDEVKENTSVTVYYLDGGVAKSVTIDKNHASHKEIFAGGTPPGVNLSTVLPAGYVVTRIEIVSNNIDPTEACGKFSHLTFSVTKAGKTNSYPLIDIMGEFYLFESELAPQCVTNSAGGYNGGSSDYINDGNTAYSVGRHAYLSIGTVPMSEPHVDTYPKIVNEVTGEAGFIQEGENEVLLTASVYADGDPDAVKSPGVTGPINIAVSMPDFMKPLYPDEIGHKAQWSVNKSAYKEDSIEFLGEQTSNGLTTYIYRISALTLLQTNGILTVRLPVNISEDIHQVFDIRSFVTGNGTQKKLECYKTAGHPGNLPVIAVKNGSTLEDGSTINVPGLGNDVDVVTSATRYYSHAVTHELQTKMSVYGDLDLDSGEEFTDATAAYKWIQEKDGLAQAQPGGRAFFKLDVKNVSNASPLSDFNIVSLLPNTGDYGIADNVARGSQFNTTLNCIVLPNEYAGKVSFYTSNQAILDLTDEFKLTEDGTTPLDPKAGAASPAWTPLSLTGETKGNYTYYNVPSGSSAKAIKFEFNGVTIEAGNALGSIYYGVNMPEITVAESFEPAYSSFITSAYACRAGIKNTSAQVKSIETPKVGVYMLEEVIPVKSVEDQDDSNDFEEYKDVLLSAINEEFTYSIDFQMPDDMTGYTSFTIGDELDSLLTVLKNGDDHRVTVEIMESDGTNPQTLSSGVLTVNGTKVSYVVSGLSDATHETYEGKLIRMTITAQIRENLTEAELIKLWDTYGGTVENEAYFQINHSPDPFDSNTVEVTVPPIVKYVKDQDTSNDELEKIYEEATLSAMNEVFTYTVSTTILDKYLKLDEEDVEFQLVDTLEEVLEFSGEPRVAFGDIDDILDGDASVFFGAADIAKYFVITKSNGTITLTTTPAFIADLKEDPETYSGMKLALVFDAKIKSTVTLADLIAAYGGDGETPKIPNNADLKFRFGNSPQSTVTSNDVYVVPPGVITKRVYDDFSGNDVNPGYDAVLSARNEEFRYEISVPASAFRGETASFSVYDVVDPFLEISADDSDNPKVKLFIDRIEIDAGDIGDYGTFTLTRGANGDGDKIEFNVDWTDSSPAGISQLKDSNDIKIVFYAKLKASVTDDQILARFGSTRIPNQAVLDLSFTDVNKESNTVYVRPPVITPPGPDPDPDPTVKKTVNDVSPTNDNPALKYEEAILAARTEKFTYTVSTPILKKYFSSETQPVVITLSDRLEDVFTPFGKTTVILGDLDYVIGKTAVGSKHEFTLSEVNSFFQLETVTTNGRTTITLRTQAAFIDYLKQNAGTVEGKSLVLQFDAKIRDTVTNEELISRFADSHQNPRIPNVGHLTVSFGNAPSVDIDSNVVHVVPPPEVEKRVYDEQSVNDNVVGYDAVLSARTEGFRYEVSVPGSVYSGEPDSFVVSDTVDSFLTITKESGNAKAELYVDGQQISAGNIAKYGTFSLTAGVGNVGDKITFNANMKGPLATSHELKIVFYATLKESVTDEQIFERFSSMKIPNQAVVSLSFGDTKYSNVVYITTPEPSDPTNPPDGSSGLYISKLLQDENGNLIGTGKQFAVDIFDEGKTLIRRVIITANSDRVYVGGLTNGKTYYVAEEKGAYTILGYEIVGIGSSSASSIGFTIPSGGVRELHIIVHNQVTPEELVDIPDGPPPYAPGIPEDPEIIEIPEDPVPLAPNEGPPKTGDSGIGPFILLGVLSSLGLLILLPKTLGKKRKT